jgi:hypothetical protein
LIFGTDIGDCGDGTYAHFVLFVCDVSNQHYQGCWIDHSSLMHWHHQHGHLIVLTLSQWTDIFGVVSKEAWLCPYITNAELCRAVENAFHTVTLQIL